MATDLGELRARLTLESQQFQQRMEDTRNHLQHAGRSANDVNIRFQSLNSSLQTIGISSEQIDKINKQIRRANPQILQQMLADVRTELEGLGMDSSEIEKITAEIERAESGTKSFEESLTDIQTAAAGVGAAVVAAIGVSVKTAMDFEAQMSRVKAISGATDDEFKDLENSALSLGATTSKSASEVAVGFEEMAAMGFNANEIISAMPGVIAAAEASGADLSKTSQVVASTLNIFSLEASKASKVADILAKTANISAADITDMQYALKYAGPPAAALGISLEELAASIGVMTNAGMEGEQAGTTLRATLLSLLNPSDENSKMMKKMGIAITDSKGNFVGLSKLVDNLRKSMEGQTETQQAATLASLVGTEAVSGMLSLMKAGPQTIDELTNSLKDSAGASKAAADVMKDNLKGAYDELNGALETIGIKLGKEFLPFLTDITKLGANAVSTIAEMDMSTVNAGIAFAGASSAIALTISTISKLAIAVKGLMFSMGPGGWLIVGISLLGGAIASTIVHQREMEEVSLERLVTAQKEIESLNSMTSRYDELKNKMSLTTYELGRYLDINNEIKQTVDPNTITKLKDEQDKLLEKSGLTNVEFAEFLELNDKIIEKVPESNIVLSDQGKIMLENTDAAKKLTQEKVEQLRLDLEAAKAAAEANMQENLEKRKQIQGDLNQLSEERNSIEKELKDQIDLVAEREAEIRTAKDKGNNEEAFILDRITVKERLKLQELRDQYAQNLENIKAKGEEAAKIDEEIGKLDAVNQKMVDLELRQVGLTAKKGEALNVIDAEIEKLEEQKRNLEASTPAAARTTQEYQAAVGAIQSQIDRLQGAKTKVQEITNEGRTMNSVLGASITKTVNVVQTPTRAIVNRINRGTYHTGGIVGHGQMPMLHTGGLASQFMNSPMHNEVDVRLLRNEWVITEAQQANLFRMIDAGFVKPNQNESPRSYSQQVTNFITVEGSMDKDLYDEIMTKQQLEFENELIKAGVKS
ncbi:phage tail tape measure protein [Bacillus sp. 03113]|uniref:phage tail tape measure protein n=1 Tax=Bacillus sp. 03113 TaxID=2578211 RepID=UPI001141FFAD|nr:phage tail tape measure protein [Bacillus sp. 03113]